jgi:hypothetical protein
MKIEAMAAVKMVKQYDVGKAIEVLQAIMVLIEYLDRDDANQNGLASQPGPVMHRTQQYSKQIPREVFG